MPAVKSTERSILENLSYGFSSIANVIGAGASAVSTACETCDVLAGTGLIMATNVQETTLIESAGKKQAKLEVLYERFPDLKGKTLKQLTSDEEEVVPEKPTRKKPVSNS